MRYKCVMRTAFCIILILSFYSTTRGFAEEVVTFAIGDYPPFSHKTELKNGGIVVDIINEAYALEGIKVKWKWRPWKRAMQEVKLGETDGTPIWTRQEKRKEFFYYSDPLVYSGRSVFWALKSFQLPKSYDPKIFNYEVLKGLRLGGIRGNNYGDKINKLVDAKVFSMRYVETAEQNFKMLLSDRIDILLSSDVIGSYELNKNFSPEEAFKITTYPRFEDHEHHDDDHENVTEDSYYNLMSKESKKGKYFNEAFNRGIKKLRKSGRYDELMVDMQAGKYILKKEK